MMVVLGSCSKKASRSSSSISDLLPRPTIADTPIFAEREKPMIAMPMPPDCEHGAGDFFLAAFHQRAGNEFRGDREHRGVDHAGHVLDALVGLVAEDIGGLRVDRIDLALVAAVD